MANGNPISLKPTAEDLGVIKKLRKEFPLFTQSQVIRHALRELLKATAEAKARKTQAA